MKVHILSIYKLRFNVEFMIILDFLNDLKMGNNKDKNDDFGSKLTFKDYFLFSRKLFQKFY